MTDAEALSPDENVPTFEETDENTDADVGVPESSDGDEEDEDNEEESNDEAKDPSMLQRFKSLYLNNKKKSIPATLAIILAIVLCVPTTRYSLLGLVLLYDSLFSLIVTKSNLPFI